MLDHAIFTRWPAQYPDRLQLFPAPRPNGVKVGIMLEETSLAYEAHRIDIMADESHDPAFLALNPERQDPRNLRPRRAERQAAHAVRIGCDPPLSCRQDGTIYLGSTRKCGAARAAARLNELCVR